MNRISFDQQCQIIAALVDDNSIRGTARILRMTKNAVARNAKWIGDACLRWHDANVHGLTKTVHVETDEVWHFIHARSRNLPGWTVNSTNFGDTWTWISLCRDSRLVISWHVGKHTMADAHIQMGDLARRVPGHVTLSTDQLAAYRPAIESAFGSRADYATIRKSMGPAPLTPDGKYEQPTFEEARCFSVFGNPDLEETSTNRIERQNLTLRMSNRRYDRHSNAHSKKIENHRAALAIHYMYYNYCRYHEAIRCTPAMQAGLTDHIWEIEEMLEKVKADEGRDVGYLNRKCA